MAKKAATFSLDEDLIALIPEVMRAKNFKRSKSDFISMCVVVHAMKYVKDKKVKKLVDKLWVR